MGRLFTQFSDGGDFMWVILLVGAFAIAVMLERTFFVIFKSSINAKRFASELERLISNRNMEQAIALCNTSNSALAKVLREVVKNHAGTGRDMQVAADAKTLEVLPELEKRTGYLDMLGQIATLLGLLGTISGLMMAFDAVSQASPEDAAAMLGKGIAAAMLTTMFGLVVAVPCLIVAAIIKAKTKKITDEIDMYTVQISTQITRMKG